MSNNEIQPLGTRQLAFTFTRKNTTTVVDPTANTTTTSSGETTFSVSNVTIIAILGTFAAYSGILEHLGSFLASLVLSPEETSDAVATRTQFVVTLSNFGCKTIDVSKEIKVLQGMDWRDSTSELTPTIVLRDNMCPSKLLTFLEFRNKLKSWDYLKQQTLLMLDRQYGTPDGPMSQLLTQLLAVSTGDNTGSGSGDQSAAWAKGLFNRITTGGPNGSMAGKIAVNFMSTVPVAASFDFTRKSKRNAFDDTTNPLVQILKDAVTSAAESAAQGLADYLKTLRKPSTTSDETDDDRQTATVVKGIKDSMPSTGRTVAQLAVFNALGNKEMAKLPRDQQLRVAYTVANATRATVEATGNHIADLYQTDSIPKESELAAVGARSLLDFLKSVGTTVANGVMQAAPVVLNAVINSSSANNALGSTLPPSIALSASGGLHELDTPTKITLASRIVNGAPNTEATVVTDKAVSDLADRQSNLGAQATLDTFTNTPPQPGARDSEPTQEQRDKFREVALEMASISPTFSNVTDIGATNLVTDSSLKHADALRQNTLEMGIRSCANMIADHQSAEILYKVHLYRLKSGLEVQPRSFTDFLKTAVPIAANIAKVAAPALLALL